MNVIQKKTKVETVFVLDDGTEFDSAEKAKSAIQFRALLALHHKYHNKDRFIDIAFADLVRDHFSEIEQIMKAEPKVVNSK
jgi:hypothetical protein